MTYFIVIKLRHFKLGFNSLLHYSVEWSRIGSEQAGPNFESYWTSRSIFGWTVQSLVLPAVDSTVGLLSAVN